MYPLNSRNLAAATVTLVFLISVATPASISSVFVFIVHNIPGAVLSNVHCLTPLGHQTENANQQHTLAAKVSLLLDWNLCSATFSFACADPTYPGAFLWVPCAS